jgi:hypothetical protein
MQLTASKPAVYAWSVCRRERMLRACTEGSRQLFLCLVRIVSARVKRVQEPVPESVFRVAVFCIIGVIDAVFWTLAQWRRYSKPRVSRTRSSMSLYGCAFLAVYCDVLRRCSALAGRGAGVRGWRVFRCFVAPYIWPVFSCRYSCLSLRSHDLRHKRSNHSAMQLTREQACRYALSASAACAWRLYCCRGPLAQFVKDSRFRSLILCLVRWCTPVCTVIPASACVMVRDGPLMSAYSSGYAFDS